MTKNKNKLESIKLWVFYLYRLNNRLNKLGWFCNYNYRLFKFYNGYYKFSKLNRFHLDVVNYFIQIGFKFFFNVVMCSYYIKLLSSSTSNFIWTISFLVFFTSTTCVLKVILNFFFNDEVLGLRFNLSWSDFLSLYSWFYEVIILKGTYAISERKMQSVSLDVKLCL
jgi:hypothetical protein